MDDLRPEEPKGFYEHDLDIKLKTIIDLYTQDRENYWQDKKSDYQIEYDRAERFADLVLKGVENLVSTQKIDEDLASFQYEINKENLFWKRLVEEARKIKPGENFSREQILLLAKERPEDPQSENSPLHLVWERFCVSLAWQSVEKMVDGADRIFKLYKLILSSPPSRPTLDYLLRLSRCYIWGFEPECVILCRSVLDTAFNKDVVDVDICEKHRGKRKNNEFTLKDRIIAAAEEKIIDDRMKKLAIDINKRGNLAVHCRPGYTKDVFGTICDTMTVLEHLQKKRQKS